jgi:hypothetical protein
VVVTAPENLGLFALYLCYRPLIILAFGTWFDLNKASFSDDVAQVVYHFSYGYHSALILIAEVAKSNGLPY